MGRALSRLAPFGSLAGLSALAVVDGMFTLAGALGIGAAYAGQRLLDKQRNRRREVRRRIRENVGALRRVAREDRAAAPQMKRLVALQDGIIESFELLPEEYAPLVAGELFTILEEVHSAARLARRRSALRRYLAGVDCEAISGRVEGLGRELAELAASSPLRLPFRGALDGRRDELGGYDDVRDAISAINACLEGVESLLGGLRGELLALGSTYGSLQGPLESDLARVRERVSYFRKGLNDVTRSVDTSVEELSALE